MCCRQFASKVVIITGAASGIGAKTAELFAKEGALLAIADKDPCKLEQVRKDCAGSGICGPLSFPCDVRKEKDIKKLIDGTIKTYCKLDILINSAASIHFDGADCTTIENFQKVFENNTRSIVNMSCFAIPHLIKSKGNMVCVSSVCGIRAFPNLLSYCVSQSAIDQFVRCASLDMAPKGVRINGVNPGVVCTDLFANAGLEKADIQKFFERSKHTHPLGRPGQPEEVARMIAFLASSKADWITGACYAVDGGWQLNCPI